VRARAAEVGGGVAALAPELAAAVDDAEPRVREAAIGALGRLRAAGASPAAGVEVALARRVGADPWTFVRAGAARSLGALPADEAADRALGAALGDRSAEVRAAALDALGAHRARGLAERVRARQDDEDEQLDVRARAILALAAMCDARSTDLWTKLARRAASPQTDVDRLLGAAAIAALGDLHPADLDARLAALAGKDVPREVREAAKAALGSAGVCR
jgi:HEAT repeat protein